MAREKGVWWLKTPEGKRMLSLGVAGVSPGVPLGEYRPASPSYCAARFHPSLDAWRKSALERVKGWGFNTLGAGSESEILSLKSMPYTVTLDLGKAAGVPWSDPDSVEARARYREALAPFARLRGDANLIGYFLDGELGWWDESVFLHVLRQPADKDPLKQALMDMVRKAYRGDVRRLKEDIAVRPEAGEFDDLKAKLKSAAFRPGRRPLVVDEYLEWLAGRYYRAATEEVRRADPGHLILGDRYAGSYCQPVARAAGKYVDVVSTNYNTIVPQGWVSPSYITSLARLSGKPVLVSECCFAAAENLSGNRNQGGRFMTVASQRDRARGAARLCEAFLKYAPVIGYHWFQYSDQPPGEEEGFNTGLVSVKDQPYDELAKALRKVNEEAEKEHGAWPAGIGLARAALGFKLPALADLPIVDGRMDEWPLAEAWLPDTASAAPFEPFGDVYLAWHAEGLAVAVVYLDYRARERAAGSGPEDAERLTLGFGVEDEQPVAFTLKGIQQRKDADDPASAFADPEVEAVRGGVRFPAEGRFLVAQSAAGVTRVVEVFLPAVLFKRSEFEAATMVRATVSLRLRANFKELFWPRRLKLTSFQDSSGWASLVLGSQEAEKVPAIRRAPAREAAGGTPGS